MIKAELRKIYLARQRALSGAERFEKSRQIARRFFQNFDLKNVQFLHVFLPIEKNREIDTWLILRKIWQDFPQVKTISSRVNFESLALENVIFSAETEFVINKWHIREPLSGKTIEAEKLDIVLVPLLAFDKKGARVGYGKGFYDRFLSLCRPDALKVGLSYFPPLEEIDDLNDFDIKLDFCVMPLKICAFEK